MTSTKVHKPFDLEAAKRGEPIMMADGTPCKFLFHCPETKEVYVLAKNRLDAPTVFVRGEDGTGRVTLFDAVGAIVMIPKKTTLYLNIYRRGDDGFLYVGGTHYTHVAARWSPSSWLCSALNYVKTVTVEIEE